MRDLAKFPVFCETHLLLIAHGAHASLNVCCTCASMSVCMHACAHACSCILHVAGSCDCTLYLCQLMKASQVICMLLSILNISVQELWKSCREFLTEPQQTLQRPPWSRVPLEGALSMCRHVFFPPKKGACVHTGIL